MDIIASKLQDIKEHGNDSLDDLAECRRREFDRINLEILQVSKMVQKSNNDENHSEELKGFQEKLDELLRVEDRKAIEKIGVEYHEFLNGLTYGDVSQFIFAKSDVEVEDIEMFLHPAPKNPRTLEVNLQKKCA